MKAFFSSALLAGALNGAVAAAIEPSTLIRLSTSVLKVEVIRAQGGYSLGSGVVVGADRVVTNCHVTRDARLIAVLQGGLRLPATSQRVDADHDLCLLRVPGVDSARAVTLAPAGQLVLGQPLTAIGHTAGALQSSVGEVLALHRMEGTCIIQSSNYFSSGASGGGLFDADMRLVGILTFRLRGGLNHYFAVPTEWLQRDLQDADDREQAIGPQPPGQPAFWERSAAAQPFFLRAAVYENEGNWGVLQTLVRDWLRRDANDPEPWYLLGLALSRQDRPGEARHALRCALVLAPESKSARAELQQLEQRPDATTPETVAAAALPCRLQP